MDRTTPGTTHRRWRRVNWLAIVALVAIGLLCWRVTVLLGGFDLMATVAVDGDEVRVANTYATVDHPFHATRADTLLKSIQAGEILRWIGHHHGGYPVEFYPLGIAWLDVGLWAVLLGSYPIVAVHKLGVIAVFLMPVVGFWILARGDRLNPFVPLLALGIHVAVPGLWTSGGYLELVEWGLVANVGGATLALIALAALGRYVLEGGRWFGALAVLSSSGALYTNMRSGIAVAVAAICILLVALVRADPGREVTIRVGIARVAIVAVASALLTAPLLVAMGRYAGLYDFVHFNEFATFAEYWDATVASVTWWFLAPAMAGLLIAALVRQLTMMRIVALTVAVYALLTVILSRGGMNDALIAQLETPRLMPFQRLLTVYLAAAAIGWLLARVANVRPSRWSGWLVGATLVAIVVVAAGRFPGTFAELPVEDRTHRGNPTTGVEEFARFTSVLSRAEEIRPEGTAVFVVGDREGWWHEQLWGPSVSPAPFLYDDWMWYWHPDRADPYNRARGHFLPDPVAAFTPEWLHQNGVGVLVVTSQSNPRDPRQAAAASPLLQYQETVGQWDLYLVADAAPIVTNGDVQPASLAVENHRIVATFDRASGPVEVRHNWFPRWRAYADGERVEIERTSAGTMRVQVPDGTSEVELRYAVTVADWLARGAALLGVVLTLAIGSGLLNRTAGRFYSPGASRASWTE